jgi:mono/diheme cytochrome c family protein
MKRSIAFGVSVSAAGAAFVLLVVLLALGSGSGLEVWAADSEQATDGGDSLGVDAEWVLPEPEQAFGLREGQRLFLHYCATCHGEAGEADGFNAYNLDPRPRDLSDPEFQANRSDVELYELIRLGGGAAGLSATMPPWGKTIDRRGLSYLVDFVRHLARLESPEPGSEVDAGEQ